VSSCWTVDLYLERRSIECNQNVGRLMSPSSRPGPKGEHHLASGACLNELVHFSQIKYSSRWTFASRTRMQFTDVSKVSLIEGLSCSSCVGELTC
jgi:hypothetical protein